MPLLLYKSNFTTATTYLEGKNDLSWFVVTEISILVIDSVALGLW